MDNSFISSILLIVCAIGFTEAAVTRPPAMFLFGDSTVDVGTNSYISKCEAKADFPYYGIDFENSKATGRFSNGFNTADYLSKLFGFERSPDSFFYLSRLGKLELFEGLHCSLTWTDLILSSFRSNGWRKMLECMKNRSSDKSNLQREKFRGVNFASGGSGLLDKTAKLLVKTYLYTIFYSSDYHIELPNTCIYRVKIRQNVLPMSEQVNQFIAVQNKLMSTIGESSTHYLLSESIFIMSSGNNDILEYFENSNSGHAEEFIGDLMIAYETYIKVLYNLGARKFGIVSVVPTGCCPSQRLLNATRGCLDSMNDICLNFHSAIETVLHKISLELSEFRYSLGNTYDLMMNIIQNPFQYDFKYVDHACCGSGDLGAVVGCNETTSLCKTRNEYLFWDRNHPSEAAARLMATMFYDGELQTVSPINFAQLAADIPIHII